MTITAPPAHVRRGPGRHAAAEPLPAAWALPAPPDEHDVYAFMGRQHRWLLAAQAVSFLLIAYSVLRFATANPHLLLFLVPMSLYTVTLVVSLLSSTRGKTTSLPDHLERLATWTPRPGQPYPSVDVFLPSAGEDLAVLANTYRHVAQLDWPGVVEVWVLDDSARPEVADLAAAAGFRYRTRPNRGYLKKAGNLRYGYEQSTGDIIAIFDADFVPRPDYLRHLVPYLDDEHVGIVQSPQFFDTPRGMPWLQRCAGATQELFYRFIQPARDRAGAAICVGTCALYRRAALDAAGGFAQIGHSEDVHTGVKMLRVGYRVQYVPVVVSKGLCPDTLLGFLNQQYRWCTGSMSLLMDTSFHNDPHLTWRKRICFWAGFLYYISTAVNAICAPLPALAMLWYLPRWVVPMNSVWLLGAYALWLFVIPRVMHGRWRIDVLRVQVLYSFAHLVAIGHILTGRTKEWVATGAVAKKRTGGLATTILRVARTWTGLTLAATWVGLARGIHEYGFGRYWAMVACACVAAYIQIPVLLTPAAGRKQAAPVPALPTQRTASAISLTKSEA